MSDIETSPAELMQQFDGAIEARLAPAKSETTAIDPRLKAIFIDAVARALDVVDLTSEEICTQFMVLAAGGVDLVRPPSIKINGKFEPLLPMYPYDKTIPIVRPAADDADMPLGIHFP